jgi:outer membrane murein-binding lipoprotein Lpp
MRKTLRFACVVVLLASFPRLAGAQTRPAAARTAQAAEDVSSLLAVIQALSQHVDQLQARLDAEGAPSLAWVDGVSFRVEDRKILVSGWGFVCNEEARLVIVIDGIEVPRALVATNRPERPDVVAAFVSPGCRVPDRAGVNAEIDALTLGTVPTLAGHKAAIRVYDLYGRARTSRSVTFTIPE